MYDIIFANDKKYNLLSRSHYYNDYWQTNKGSSFDTFLFLQEVFMSDFTVTDQAVEKLKEYLEQNNISSALRIALMQGG